MGNVVDAFSVFLILMNRFYLLQGEIKKINHFYCLVSILYTPASSGFATSQNSFELEMNTSTSQHTETSFKVTKRRQMLVRQNVSDKSCTGN